MLLSFLAFRMWRRWIGLAAAFLVLGAVPRANGQPAGLDPVEELRQALQVSTEGAAQNPEILAHRERSVRRGIDALRSLGQMRRALFLTEWRDDSKDEAVARSDAHLRGWLAVKFRNAVTDVLRRDDPVGRIAVANLLASMGIGDQKWSRRGTARGLAPDLVRLIRSDKDPEVRAAAARALGRVDPSLGNDGVAADGVMPSLVDLLKNGSVAERRAAAGALRDLVQVVLQQMTTAGGQLATSAELQRVVEAVLPAAAPGLTDADAEVSARCANAIRLSASGLSEPSLLLAVPLRTSQELPPPGRKLTKAERHDIEQYVKQLVEERARLAPLVQSLAVQVPRLAKLVNDPNPRVCVAAAEALETLAAAQQQLHRRADLMSTGVLADNSGVTERVDAPKSAILLRDALRAAIPALATGVTDRRRTVAVRLASLYVLETMEVEARPAARELVQVGTDENPFLRWGAARALGKMAARPPTGAALALGKLVGDENNDVRLTAFAALQRYGPSAKAAVPALVAALETDDPEAALLAVQTLAAVGVEARPAAAALVKILSAKEAHLRAAAARALGRLGPPQREIAAALRKAMHDPDPAVREAASVALLGGD
jgi:HEAT repeat protein